MNELKLEDPEPSKTTSVVNFKNTEIAFANKSDKELKRMQWLFKRMNNAALVKFGSKLGLFAVKFRLPFAELVIKNTIFQQFCGGENLLDCQKTIDKLHKNDVLTILDYGAEGKSTEADLNQVKEENIKAIEMAASNNSVPCISIKLTGLIENEILEVLNEGKTLNEAQKEKYNRCIERVYDICQEAHTHGVGVLIDAEESWIQKPIDEICLELMEAYNQEKVIVFNTYQLYRHDKLAQLKSDFEMITSTGCLFGAKLVRGAYMEKENARAEDMGYVSPIQKSKANTDRDYNEGLQFCLDNHEKISFICATHNLESSQLLADWVDQRGIEKSHPHINFSQLAGMSDYVTFNLADAGYNVAKYVPYGPVREVIPYLIRRAQENTSVTGEMGRELALVTKEIKRRGL